MNTIRPMQEWCIVNLAALESGRRMAKKAANMLSEDIYGVPYKALTIEQASEFIQYLAGKRILVGQQRK